MTEEPLETPGFPYERERLLLPRVHPADYYDIHAYASDGRGGAVHGLGPNTPAQTREHLDLKLKEQGMAAHKDVGPGRGGGG